MTKTLHLVCTLVFGLSMIRCSASQKIDDASSAQSGTGTGSLATGNTSSEMNPSGESSVQVTERSLRLTKGQVRKFIEKRYPNGLTVLFVSDPSLPALSLQLLMRGGSVSDPKGKEGLAQLVAELLDQGTKNRSAAQIADDLAQLGADFEAGVGHDSQQFSVSGLSFNGDKLVRQFYEIVTQPSFADRDLIRTRGRLVSQMEKAIDNPRWVADRASDGLFYGGHPYGRPSSGTPKTLRGLRKRDVISFYLKNYRPGLSYLAVTGRYDQTVVDEVDKTFGKWAGRVTKFPNPVQHQVPDGLQIRVVEKKGITQAQIRFASQGIPRNHPDFLALRVANTAFGGSFASRLIEAIRKPGYTYSIRSNFDTQLWTGAFRIDTFTKTETIDVVVKETLKQMQEFASKGITREELDSAKPYLAGLFPQAIETSEKLASNLLLLRLYGVGDAYLTNYLEDLDDLSLSQVNDAVKRNLKAENTSVTIYGPPGSGAQLKSIAARFTAISVNSLR